MSELRTNIYEGMFLFPQSATADFQGVINHVTEIINRADAELLAMKKWDERRLAYDIKGNKRGLYILAYFKADRQRIAGIERDCNLSEELLRSLVIRADHIPMEVIEGSDERAALADEAVLRKAEADAAEATKTTEAAKAADAVAAASAAHAEAEANAETKETVPDEAPAEAPAEAPVETPIETPVETPAETPAEGSNEEPTASA